LFDEINLLSFLVFSQPSNVPWVILYRFADATGLTSRLSRAPFYKRWWVLLKKRLSSSYKRKLGEAHAGGMVKDSPFISTLEDIDKGANTPDPWLRKIITGEDIGFEQLGEVKQAPYLYKLRVPESKIYKFRTEDFPPSRWEDECAGIF